MGIFEQIFATRTNFVATSALATIVLGAGAVGADTLTPVVDLNCSVDAPRLASIKDTVENGKVDAGFLKTRPLNPEEIASVKGCELGKIKNIPKQRVSVAEGTYDIEVSEINPQPYGAEVFVRAWKPDGKQVGFGKDGTVEIERVRIFNPGSSVEDPNGPIIVESTDSLGRFKVQRFREDPEQWLKNDLAHTLSIIEKPGDKIEPGKRGNTTSTFNPASGANSPVDAAMASTDQTTWNAAHDDTDSNVTGVTTADDVIAASRSANASSHFIFRGVFLFDTSSIPDTDTISSATFSLRATLQQVGDNDGNDFAAVVSSAPANTNTVVGTDFDAVGDAINNPTEMHDAGERKDLSGISTVAYTDWTLNSTGIANISKTGISKFGLREGHDILDDPVAITSTYTLFYGRLADDGSGTPPKLVVEHAASVATGPTPGANDIIYY